MARILRAVADVAVSTRLLEAWIFDVDGVLLASPHERAWREALHGITDPDRLTTATYQAVVAGRSRLDGAHAALTALGVPDVGRVGLAYAAAKQHRLEVIIETEGVVAFPDALRLVRRLKADGWPIAAASSSRNAESMMRMVDLDRRETMFDAFAVTVCGRDLRHGKPDPEIFLLAAAELGIDPTRCIVVEDAPAGIAAALAGGMATLGVARVNDADGLSAAGAERVVASLDEILIPERAASTAHRPAA
ncbi:MAG: HAD-IA family hydrolase [Methylobacterium sp.]|nr:HAD-IA family hydrolase [Methylobacterium sp.]MDO9425207.1 HAD-IA family hydrolase [Methylobacterium sp.]